MRLSAEAMSLNSHLFVAEDKIVSMSEEKLIELLKEIGYSPEAIELLVTYRSATVAIREKLGFKYE